MAQGPLHGETVQKESVKGPFDKVQFPTQKDSKVKVRGNTKMGRAQGGT